MKKCIIIVLSVVVIFMLAALLVWNLTDKATAVNGDISVELSFADSWKLRDTLSIEEIRFDGAGCPFYADYSIKMGGLTYQLAEDSCEAIYIPELNLYYLISGEDHVKLHEILKEYGIGAQRKLPSA